MNILDTIVGYKRKEIEQNRDLYPIKLLEKSIYYNSPCVSLVKYLNRADLFGVIAEIKRASPSVGDLHPHVSVEKLSIGYMQHGASALSVLTDKQFFKGSLNDLKIARKFNFCPVLRKDFIIDEYQLHEARSYGADVVLLIARILTPERVKALALQAQALGLEVLLEVHSADEVHTHLCEEITLVGINARNLDTLKIDPTHHEEILSILPNKVTPIAESGIREASELARLKKVGFQGFLIGETFMRTTDPARTCGELIRKAKDLYAH